MLDPDVYYTREPVVALWWQMVVPPSPVNENRYDFRRSLRPSRLPETDWDNVSELEMELPSTKKPCEKKIWFAVLAVIATIMIVVGVVILAVSGSGDSNNSKSILSTSINS